MKVLRREIAWFLGVVACCSTGTVLADIGSGRNEYDSRWASVEKAFEAAKESRDLSQVKEELRKFFTSPSQDMKLLGLQWVGYRKADLREEELDEIAKFFIALNPDNSMSNSVRVEMANRHLANSSVEERRAVYMAAIRDGIVRVDNAEEIPRVVAFGKAAADGLEDFRLFIEQYRDEIDRAYPADPYRRSEKLLWMLKLRAGAVDRKDAVRLHASRLAEMNDESFARLMNNDPAFRAATINVLIDACEKPLAEPCLNMAEVALDQAELKEKRKQSKTGDAKTAESAAGGDWVEGIQGLTAAARAKVSRERVEARMRER